MKSESESSRISLGPSVMWNVNLVSNGYHGNAVREDGFLLCLGHMTGQQTT